MKIWIINPYGNLPGEGWRDYRSTLLANALVSKGYDVTWWVSNFEHRSKKFRSESWEELKVNDNFTIKLVPSTSYISHISIKRILYERTFAKNLRNIVFKTNEKPDLIILAEPALFISDIVLNIINKFKVPLLVDILDLWPELFNIVLPNKLKFLGKYLLAPLYLRRSKLLRAADGIVGATNDYLQVATLVNNTKFSRVVYLGIDLTEPKKESNSFFSSLNLVKDEKELWVIYAGTLGDNYDIKTIIDCAKKIEKKDLFFKIFIAGDGPLKFLLEEQIALNNLNKLIYLGRMEINDLDYLYSKCDIALSSYVNGSTVSMPVKAYDYLAAGLPLVNSLNRELGHFVKAYKIGLQYQSENFEDMFNCLIYLYNNPLVLNEMKLNAKNLAKKFDVKIQYENYVNLVDELLLK